MKEPILYNGGISIDDRGKLGFINVPLDIKRFYFVSNHCSHFIRAWHAHKLEAKYVTVVQGTALIKIIKIDNFENPSEDLNVEKFVLSAEKPQILYIPAGYANGWMNLTKNTIIMFLSTSTVEESKNDDFRYQYNKWEEWEIIPR